eukprot:CAMPEP_0172377116 /NCGR_PEP_ID=MMETSP1060-20121228/68738_1 /TAXON_ID=37318 /ORGANISM="Pseudo-nitzschia pungens, Strain cf. cingulata" /LENGTH=416 /DNA_ID=CAMNT_0013104787 /DNA_START=77 /DNA_END=1327 /DNA_ORIENTATION=-
MTTATLDASVTRLEGIKGKKHLYDRKKIAEAEALAAEALRMANEAKLAAARLAEVKKTLALFSSKLESAEKSVDKDAQVKPIPIVLKEVSVEKPAEEPSKEDTVEAVAVVEKAPVDEAPVDEAPVEEAPVEEAPVEEAPVEEAPVEETPVEETPVEETPVEEAPVEEAPVTQAPVVEGAKEDPPITEDIEVFPASPASSRKSASFRKSKKSARVVFKAYQIFDDDDDQRGRIFSAPQIFGDEDDEEVSASSIEIPNSQEHDIVEDFLDSLGLDSVCGVDDETLGFKDRPKKKKEVFEVFVNPTKFENPTKSPFTFKEESTSENIFMNMPSIHEEYLVKVAAKQPKEVAAKQSKEPTSTLPVTYNHISAVNRGFNRDFNDPFGSDHDDLVICGRLADVCEPPGYSDYSDVPAGYRRK